jgi:hypothetical protein
VEIVSALADTDAPSEPPPPDGDPVEERLAVPALAAPTSEDESVALPRPLRPLVTLGSLTPPPVVPSHPASGRSAPQILPKAPPAPVITSADETPSRAVRRPSSYLAGDRPAPASRDPRDLGKPSRSMWGLFAVAGIVFAVGARLSRDRELAMSAAAPSQAPAGQVLPLAEPRAAEAPAPPAPSPPADVKGEGESKADPILPQEGPLRPDDKVPPGQGMLEVVAGTSDTIWIDGTVVGNGPIVKRALAPKKEPYEIRVRLRGDERVRFVLVREGRLTRLRVAPPWSR